MKLGKLSVIALLLAGATAAHAASPLLPGLQSNLSSLKGATGKTASAVRGVRLAGVGALALPALAAKPQLAKSDTAADNSWLTYNLTQYPTDLNSWVAVKQSYATYGVGSLTGRVTQLPNSTCPDNACLPGTNPQVVGAANYAADILDIGNGAAGLVIKGPPPKPLLPSDLTSQQFWLDYNYSVWSNDIVNYAYDEYVGRTLTDSASLLRTVGHISTTEAQTSVGTVLTSLGNGAAGLVIKGPPPKPLMPGQGLP